ncbi:EmrB/QacA subfamily drug resistance transporter [Paractinoplanes brasiliensis]|uniref:EmrB/QacA subfamily drug resistance transporter n=1 Tax=Paractinoplanes brasiliensis TaxID=52695 RepID=A0A4R6JAG1_9ACTN|nr:MFS transporter [Actinoplanes brasiliensis]TDO31921.1 EmrB/QacA subfamily drug resistance transporter [Actinoplanes brasiliensis]GID27964.1 MFS transporter [Actinoplanes brasiliensis]
MTPEQSTRWKALTVALVAGFMTLLDVSIVNVALPSIRDELGLSPAELQWVLSGYALTFGLLLVPAGRFGDARGRRDAFVAGLILFTLASAAAGLARSALWLVVARLVQGAAAGIVNPQVSGLIQQMFEPKERGRPFGLLGATIGVSTAVGPLLGGLLIALIGPSEGWRWIFYLNVPIGVVAVWLGMRWIPAVAGKRRESLDPAGVGLLGLGVVLLLLPLVQEREWQGSGKWLVAVAGVLVLAGFWRWERSYGRTRTALIELGLFKVRSYALGALIGLLYFAGFTTIFFIYTLYLQSGLGYSALEAGLAITPFAVGSAVASAIGGRFVQRFGRHMVVGGLVAVVAGLAATDVSLRLVPGSGGGWAAALPLLVAGLGSGFVISPNQTLTLSEVPVARAGSAGAVLQTGQRIGTAMGIAAVGAFFFNRLAAGQGDWGGAFRGALWLTVSFVAVALAAALADVLSGRKHAADPGRDPVDVAGGQDVEQRPA